MLASKVSEERLLELSRTMPNMVAIGREVGLSRERIRQLLRQINNDKFSREAVHKLDEEIYRLYCEEGLSKEDIAKRLGIPASRLTSTWNRLRSKGFKIQSKHTKERITLATNIAEDYAGGLSFGDLIKKYRGINSGTVSWALHKNNVKARRVVEGCIYPLRYPLLYNAPFVRALNTKKWFPEELVDMVGCSKFHAEYFLRKHKILRLRPHRHPVKYSLLWDELYMSSKKWSPKLLANELGCSESHASRMISKYRN